MTNLDMNVERELTDAELETVAEGGPTLQGIRQQQTRVPRRVHPGSNPTSATPEAV